MGMYDPLYCFIESYAGVSFDPYDTLDVVSSEDAFIDPYGWKSALDVSVDNIMELLNTLEEHRTDAPDDLGNIESLKNDFARQVIGEVIDKINDVKMMLNLEITKIKGLDGLRSNISLITNLVEFCKENPLDQIMAQSRFDQLNDMNDNDMTNVLGIYNRDIMNIHQIVTDTCELYEEDEE